MEHLGSPTATKEILNKFGFSFQKRFGQNFLIDENIVKKIVTLSGVTKQDTVLEIGPGIGTMTQILSEAARQVIAVEIDKKLIEVLEYTLSGLENVKIINNDILKEDIKALSDRFGNSRPLKVVANLPYYITTPIIMRLLENNANWNDGKVSKITVMVQKEVADRINAKPGTKDYGALTLATEYYARPEYLMSVPASVFMPKPKVDSAVIDLKIKNEHCLNKEDEKRLFKIIKGAFSQRRKTFINSVSASTDFDKSDIKKILSDIGKPENIRGEALSLADFINISQGLNSL